MRALLVIIVVSGCGVASEPVPRPRSPAVAQSPLPRDNHADDRAALAQHGPRVIPTDLLAASVYELPEGFWESSARYRTTEHGSVVLNEGAYVDPSRGLVYLAYADYGDLNADGKDEVLIETREYLSGERRKSEIWAYGVRDGLLSVLGKVTESVGPEESGLRLRFVSEDGSIVIDRTACAGETADCAPERQQWQLRNGAFVAQAQTQVLRRSSRSIN